MKWPKEPIEAGFLAGLLVWSAEAHAGSISHWPPLELDGIPCRAWMLPRPPEEFGLAPDGVLQGYRWILEHQADGTWVTFALFHGDSTVTVRGRDTLLELELGDGRRVRSRDAFVCSAGIQMRPWRMQGSTGDAVHRLDPDELWRRNWNGHVVTMLWVCFQPVSRDSSSGQERPWNLEDVVRVRALSPP